MSFVDVGLGRQSRSIRKAYSRGTHRAVDPAETLNYVRPFANVMGITRIANVTGLDTIGIPVVMVCRPNSRSVSVSQGKGITLDAAKASGFMESVESFHAERIVAPLLLGSPEELRYTHDLVNFGALPRRREDPLSPFEQLLWIEGYDLIGARQKWVPYELVTLNFSLPAQVGFGTFAASSNGLASGNHTLEAVSHGICEVVERHATSRWRARPAPEQDRTCVDLDTVDDPLCQQVIAAFQSAGVMVGVWETTCEIGVPSFLCRIVQGRDTPVHSFRPSTGMGCHPSRQVALLRALTEAAQSRLTFISGARDDMPKDEYEYFFRPEIDEAWRVGMEAIEPTRNFHDIPTWESETFEEDVTWELERLVDRGIEEVVAVDLSKPEFEIPVVKIIIPKLEEPTSHRRQALQRSSHGIGGTVQ